MRQIEAEIVRRIDDNPRSRIRLDNFFGIEIKSFAAEIARLALLIAEFQSDVRLINQREAKLHVLPLHQTGQIHIGNALRMNWLEVCPPVTRTVVEEHDLAGPTGRLALEDNGLGERAEPETFICGNPPYRGQAWQTTDQKSDLECAFSGHGGFSKALDYVAGWLVLAANYSCSVAADCAFVTTNSIWQGQQVATLWPILSGFDLSISFAHASFKWANLASHNAGVTVSVVGLSMSSAAPRRLYANDLAPATVRVVQYINAYLVAGPDVVVQPAQKPCNGLAPMLYGNQPRDGGNLCLSSDELKLIQGTDSLGSSLAKRYVGSEEMINGGIRGCLWITDLQVELARSELFIAERLERVAAMRSASAAPSTRSFATRPHRFVQIQGVAKRSTIAVAKVSSENRPYLPVDLFDERTIVSDLLFAVYDAPLWNLALIASRIHLVWIATVCGKLETRYRYSNTLGWNTFPVPSLTERNKTDLTACAEVILLAREAHFPATIADLYDPDEMPEDLRAAHERNDETLERIYIGHRFRNDTERLEKLFDLYTRMTTAAAPKGSREAAKARRGTDARH